MRKLAWALSILVLLVASATLLLPGYVEGTLSHVDSRPLPPVSERAKRLHASLTIDDLHSDTLLSNRARPDRAGRGHIDLPRMRQGNLALQLFSSVTKSPKGLNYDRN